MTQTHPRAFALIVFVLSIVGGAAWRAPEARPRGLPSHPLAPLAALRRGSCPKPLTVEGEFNPAFPGYELVFKKGADAFVEAAHLAERYGVSPRVVSKEYPSYPASMHTLLDSATVEALRCEPRVVSISHTPVGCAVVRGRPGLIFVVTDPRAPEAATNGLLGIVTDGSYTDTLRASASGDTLSGAVDRWGSYTVRLEKPGYYPWVQRNLKVPRASCGNVSTMMFGATLVPRPAAR